MKVLHLIDTLGPGGAQILVKDFFENQRHNTDIHLFCLRKTQITNAISHQNLNIFNSNFKYSFLPIPQLIKYVKINKINVLHCHLFRSQVFGWLLKIFFFPKIKLIFHEHGQILGSETGSRKEDEIFEWFLKHAKKRVNIFIAVSKFVKKNLIQKAGIEESKIVLIYNSIHLNQIKSLFNTYNITKLKDENGFVLGFAGRIIEGKGWRELINCLNRTGNENLKLLIAGIGTESEKLIALIEKNDFSERVEYLGYCKNMYSEFFNRIDCLVIPSHKEALGIIALEAFAYKVPVIASDIDGLNEIVKHNQNGLLFKVKDVNDLTEKISMIQKDKNLCNRLISQAYIDVTGYDVENYIEQLEIVYNEL